jgi:exonuclease SbcC
LSQNILKLDYKILQLKQEKDNLKESKYKILKESDIESFKQNLETKKEAKERALKEIESKIRDIDIEMRLKKSSIKRLKETISNLEIDRDKFNSDFEKQLRERELNRDSFLALIKEKIDKRSLKNYLDEFKELNIQIKTLNRAIAPKQKEIDRFNIDNLELIELKRSLEETIVELNKNSEQSITEIKEIDNELSNNGKNLKEFEELKSKLEAIKSEYIIISKMNELIGSENGKKFSKFAQSITLNILVDLANSHLKELNPRYRLKRDSELNILIIDNFQAGVERGVNTLSGGESFLISLALSLALSDLVGKKVSINSLFLDEGFGSLDPKNLDIALETLSKLQNRGKTIGIISHIESLKERIPHHIKVIPQGGGVSKVEFK